MAKYSAPEDHVFSALSDPTRRAILARLAEGQRTVGELARPFAISPSGFSKHLRVLERAGLLRQHKRGRERYCEARMEPLEEISAWLRRYREMWSRSVDRFADYAEALHAARARTRKK